MKMLAIFLAISIITACNWDKADPGEKNYSNPSTQNLNANKNNTEDTPIVHKRASETAAAKDLVKLTEEVEGVENATAIVSGMYTVVGARLKPNQNSEETIQNIYESIRKDSRGANAFVTTNPTHLQTLNKWGKHINSGSLQKDEIYNDLGIMISQIKPNWNPPTKKALPSKEELDRDRVKQKLESK